MKSNDTGTNPNNVIDKCIEVIDGQKVFIAFYDASETVSWTGYKFMCSLCGWKYSSKKRYLDRMYDHWRYSHKTKFTMFALMGVSEFQIIPLWGAQMMTRKLIVGARI